MGVERDTRALLRPRVSILVRAGTLAQPGDPLSTSLCSHVTLLSPHKKNELE